MNLSKRIIPKETKEILDNIAIILPKVPMIQKNEDGSFQFKTNGEEGKQEKLMLANHGEELCAMYRAGGFHVVRQYVQATYGVAEAFYGENRLYHKLIAQ